MSTRLRGLGLLIIALLSQGLVMAADDVVPRYIEVQVTWTDPDTGQSRDIEGQLWFSGLPALIEDRGRSVERSWDIRRFVPLSPGDIVIVRAEDDQGHIWRHYNGEESFRFAVPVIPLMAQQDAVLDASLLDQAGGSDLIDDDAPEVFRDQEGPDADTILDLGRGRDDSQAVTAVSEAPLRLAVLTDPGYRSIPSAAIDRIVFRRAGDGYRFEPYTGRFVNYSAGARGDEGRVQVRAATFFGGEADEHFTAGEFLNDGSILMVANLHDLSFLDRVRVTTLGTDPAADAYPAYQREGRRGQAVTVHPRRTPVLVHYDQSLRQLRGLTRLPWGVGEAAHVFFGPDDAVYLAGRPGPHFETMVNEVARHVIVDNPGAAAHARERNRTPPADSFVMRIAPNQRAVDWIVILRHASVEASWHPNGTVLARRGRGQMLFIDPHNGAVSEGPTVDVGRGTLHDSAVHPSTGALYFGGEYHSSTGLEPWRNPWLRKFGADGSLSWTAYDWTGPLVGVAQLRLVSDSAVMQVRVGDDGNLMLRGWSDGGNSVFTRQPYDMRKPAPSSGFCNSIWGAGVLSVSYLMRMDAQTQEVYGVSRYMAYLPRQNTPNSISIRDFTSLDNGDVVVTGGSAFAFVETWDAWVEPWYIQHRRNRFAEAKGGPFFTVFTPDMQRARIATMVPGLGHARLATRGSLVLLYGSASAQGRLYNHRLDPILVDPVQGTHGGGERDAYVMLIDTQGQAQPPEIPAWTWGDRAGQR